MIATLAAVAFVELGFSWWWLAVLFLLFDVSMVGYLRSPRLGAWTYNAIHSYIGPAACGVIAVVNSSRDLGFASLVWAFHIGVDRLLGLRPQTAHPVHRDPSRGDRPVTQHPRVPARLTPLSSRVPNRVPATRSRLGVSFGRAIRSDSAGPQPAESGPAAATISARAARWSRSPVSVALAAAGAELMGQ